MRRERGLALILALLLVAAAALLALTAAGRSRDLAMDAARDRASVTARAAADGGIERARWALARDAGYTGETLRIGACDVEIRVERGDDGRATVRSIARVGTSPFAESVTQRAEADVALRADGLPGVTAWR